MPKRRASEAPQPVRRSNRLQGQPLPSQLQQEERRHSHPDQPSSRHQNQHDINKTRSNDHHLLIHPEVLFLIAAYLPKFTLFSCIQVCKDWYKILYPLIWSSLDITHDFDRTRFPDASTLRLCAPLVRQLCLGPWKFEFFDETKRESYATTYPQLSSLSITPYPIWRNWQSEADPATVIALLKRHETEAPLLTQLKIKATITPEILAAILNYRLLREFHFSDLNEPPGTWMDQYDGFWSRLRVLSFDGAIRLGPSLDDNKDSRYVPSTDADEQELQTVASILTRLASAEKPMAAEELHMKTSLRDGNIIRFQSLLILKSPNLRRLSWYGWNATPFPQTPVEFLAKELTRTELQSPPGGRGRLSLQHLKALDLHSTTVAEEDLRSVLESVVSTLNELYLSRTHFNANTWKMIKNSVPRYLNTLTVMDIQHCGELDGATVQDILCSVTSLEEFKANHVQDKDLQNDGRPWVCTKMRTLALVFVQSGDGREPLFWDRISTLRQLEVLELTGYSDNEDINISNLRKLYPFQLLIKTGLDRLRTLRQLRFLGGSNTFKSFEWGEAEVRWVLEHWVSLEVLEQITFAKAEVKDLLAGRVRCSCCHVTLSAQDLQAIQMKMKQMRKQRK